MPQWIDGVVTLLDGVKFNNPASQVGIAMAKSVLKNFGDEWDQMKKRIEILEARIEKIEKSE